MSTPLWKKLGIKAGLEVILHNEPSDYSELMDGRLKECKILNSEAVGDADFIHLFAINFQDLVINFEPLKARLKMNGMFWISWPKKSSELSSDLDKKILMEYGLSNGLVDVKVASYNDDWSSLKFVYRLKDR